MELPALSPGSENGSRQHSRRNSAVESPTGSDAKMATLQKTIRGFDSAQIEKAAEAIRRQRLLLSQLMQESREPGGTDQIKKRIHSHVRKAVTGDCDRRVRDHLLEKYQEPLIVRLLDKMAFTIGVLNIVVSEAVLLLRPDRFWMWYTVIIPLLLAFRYPYYKKRKWHYFMLDFCYWVHLFCMVQLYALPNSCEALKIAFLYANGPLAWAIPCWRNSLVFHDMEKTSSVYIHLFPGLLTLSTRWHVQQPTVGACDSRISAATFGVSLLIYIGWQAVYFVKTEIMDRPILLADPALQTSLRWLTTDSRNALHKAVLKATRRVGIMGRDEPFDPTTLKTKCIFMGTQFLFTVVTMLPATLLYSHYALHASFLLATFGFAVWNGSNFYIEVFARRYWSDLERRGVALEEQKLLRKVAHQPPLPSSAENSTAAEAEQHVHDAIEAIIENEAEVAADGNSSNNDDSNNSSSSNSKED